MTDRRFWGALVLAAMMAALGLLVIQPAAAATPVRIT